MYLYVTDVPVPRKPTKKYLKRNILNNKYISIYVNFIPDSSHDLAFQSIWVEKYGFLKCSVLVQNEQRYKNLLWFFRR
jgi:hypothetical protein